MMSELLQAGLNVTAIGLGVVFVLLTLLVGIIRGMSAICRSIEGSLPSSPDVTQATGSPEGQELASVIGAAIAAHRKHR